MPTSTTPLARYPDTGAMLNAYDNAPHFVQYFNERRSLVACYGVFLADPAENDESKATVKHWHRNLSLWLDSSQDRYNESMRLLSLPPAEVEQLREAYSAL